MPKKAEDKRPIELRVFDLVHDREDAAFKEGYVAGINYIIASDSGLYDEYGVVTWQDLMDWGVGGIIEAACKDVRKERIKEFKRLIGTP